MEDKQSHFTFHVADGKKFSTLEDRDNKELLQKCIGHVIFERELAVWVSYHIGHNPGCTAFFREEVTKGQINEIRGIVKSMDGNLCAQMFTFDQAFQPYQKNEFIMDFMKDDTVLSTLKVGSASGVGFVPLGHPACRVDIEVVPCTVLSMTFFDRLYGPLVRDSGHLKKCFDEFYEDFTISDELRKMFLLEDSDHFDLYSDTEREEFLYRLFRHICLGGQICQYEDTVDPYLNVTKQLYKDLISVQKNAETKELSILSSVFKVTAYDKEDEVIYPSTKSHEQTFSYFIVDPLKRHVTVLYHKFGGGIFS